MRGCLIVAGALLLVLAGGAALFWSEREAIFDWASESFELPAYAERDAVFSRHAELIAALDRAAERSESFFQFAAAVERAELGPEVLYVGIEKGDEEEAIVKRFDWSGHRFVVSGETGYGTLHGGDATKTVVVIDRSGSWDYMDAYRVYVERPEAAGEAEAVGPAEERSRDGAATRS